MVGRTGAGKSTILQTILRILDLYEGEILIDGQKINDMSVFDLRENICTIL